MKVSVVFSDLYCARFYALPKVYKANVPLRIFVCNIGTVINLLAKFLAVSFSTLYANNVNTTKIICDLFRKSNSSWKLSHSISSYEIILFFNDSVKRALNYLETRMQEFMLILKLRNSSLTLDYVLIKRPSLLIITSTNSQTAFPWAALIMYLSLIYKYIILKQKYLISLILNAS